MIDIVDTSSERWNKYIYKFDPIIRDIYFTSEYYKLQEANDDGKAKLFVYEENNYLAIYPFLINKIEGYNLDEEYYDIETAYGYGGPIVNERNNNFIDNFEKEFNKYCKENNIIAEFIRFHPLLKNEDIFKENIMVEHNRSTTYIDLDKGIEDIWLKDITSKNRNVIRKAEKLGLSIEFNSPIDEFRYIYEKNMEKLNVDKYYYFGDKYFFEINKVKHICISAKYRDKYIASAIFLYGEDKFHYHLAGSLEEYLSYSPNNFLLWNSIKYAKNNGFRKFHFGGGLTDNLNDNLFKFKKSFSSNVSDFYIGKRIHNNEKYKYLIENWRKENNKEPTLFLQYKYKR